MIPTRDNDVIQTLGAITLTLLARQTIAPTGGAGTIRPYAILRHENTEYQIDAILADDDTIDYFDCFDANGNCTNDGDPWYPEDPNNPDETLDLSVLADFLDTLRP